MIEYTNEMKQLDKDWEHEKEDLKRMKELQEDIIKKAKEKGYVFDTTTYEYNGEIITDVYYNSAHKNDCEQGNSEPFTLIGNCFYLINAIEDVQIQNELLSNEDFKEVSDTTLKEVMNNFEDYGNGYLSGTLKEINNALNDFSADEIILPYYNEVIKNDNVYLLIYEHH